MIYEIILSEEVETPYDVELLHDNPLSAWAAFEVMRARVSDSKVAVNRDEQSITEAELASDVKTYDIHLVMEQDRQLPSTYRHGRGGDSDLAVGGDGFRHGVWRPKNPEDNYD